MLKIKFADGTEKEVLENTTLYPTYHASMRNRMEIHMDGEAMTLSGFEMLMKDPGKTSEMHLIHTENGSDMGYMDYTIPLSIGKKRISVTDLSTGAVREEMHLVAELEQLTHIEKQLDALGIKV